MTDICILFLHFYHVSTFPRFHVFHYFAVMWKIFKSELSQLSKEIKTLDKKDVIVFLSSIILFTISWYFCIIPDFSENHSQLFIQIISSLKNYSSFIYWFLLDFLLFFIIPVYFIKLIFKENLKSYGLSFGNLKVGIYIHLLRFLFLSQLLFLFQILKISYNTFH